MNSQHIHTRNVHQSRRKYFQLFVIPTLQGEGLKNLSSTEIGFIFQLRNFISRADLHDTLKNLVIRDRGRIIYVNDFLFQLEKTSQFETPYWSISLETNTVTTGRSIVKALRNGMHLKVSVNFEVKVKAQPSFLKPKTELKYRLSLPEWSEKF